MASTVARDLAAARARIEVELDLRIAAYDRIGQLVAQVAELQHVIDCAGTPLMSDVLRERDAALAREQGLQAGIEDYLLWEPGKRGHAEAHRKLAALASSDVPATSCKCGAPMDGYGCPHGH